MFRDDNCQGRGKKVLKVRCRKFSRSGAESSQGQWQKVRLGHFLVDALIVAPGVQGSAGSDRRELTTTTAAAGGGGGGGRGGRKGRRRRQVADVPPAVGV